MRLKLAKIGLEAFVLLAGVVRIGGQSFVNAEVEDINTILMRSTFRIHGRANDMGGISVGTVFIIGRPIKGQPNRGAYVLVTAAHVLEAIKGENATLLLREQTGDGWKPLLYDFPIRGHRGEPLYIKHPSADVAAMYIRVPSVVSIPL
jgi:hypothetical protein